MADNSEVEVEAKPLKSPSTDILSSLSNSLREANSNLNSANEHIQLKLGEANTQIKLKLEKASSEIQSKLEEANTQIKTKLDEASTHIQAKLNDGTDSIKKTGNMVVSKLSVAGEFGIGAVARALNSEGEIDILALRLVSNLSKHLKFRSLFLSKMAIFRAAQWSLCVL